MNNEVIVRIIFASLIGGCVYWLLELREYFSVALGSGLIPFDAFVMLIPVLLFALAAGLLFCLPIYIFLKKYGRVKSIYILALSTSVAILFVNGITGKWFQGVDNYLNPAIAGLLAGLFFVIF